MNEKFEDFLNQLEPGYLEKISQDLTDKFSEHNNYPQGAIEFKDFVSFANYSSRVTTLNLLEKYHEWLND